MFSARTDWPLAPNRLHRLARARRAAGSLLDLTVSNPTQCGFDYPDAQLLAALSSAAALRYQPQPLGLLSARAAVSAYYADRGQTVTAEHLLLTASTSEAYAHLFRLLCDAGDAVLMPAPSYPLFEMLAGLNDVRLLPSPMLYDQGWQLDRTAIDRTAAGEGRLRALLLVHPNNPAGCYLKPGEWQWLQGLAAERGWAVVVDEVFFDFPMPPHTAVALDYAAAPALTFVLNGFSKIAGLPQMKLGWIAVHGPAPLRAQALERLEVINDMFLSVDAPIQHAAAAILQARHGIQRQIQQRVQANLATLDAALAACPALERLAIEGGWNAIVRLPQVRTDEAWAELILEHAGVLTHPGHFYNMNRDAHLVVSLLPQPAAFQAGAEALTATASHVLA